MGGLDTLLQQKKIDYPRILNALLQNLLPTIDKGISPQFFTGKMETFLTCRAVADHLMKINLLDERDGKFFEELALRAIYKTLSAGMTFADARLLINEMYNILPLNYPVVNDIRLGCMRIISEMINTLRLNDTDAVIGPKMWLAIVELENILNLLKTFDDYNHK